MSTPIQQDELSPDDPIFYAPPKWRTGERTAQLPESAGSSDWTARDDGLSFADAVTKSRPHSGGIEHSRVRITAFACAVADCLDRILRDGRAQPYRYAGFRSVARRSSIGGRFERLAQ